MPNWEAYAEADRRGILPPEKKALYEEAKSRGLVPGITSGEPTQEPKTFAKEFNAGVGRGFIKAGEGLKQRGLELGGALGVVSPETVKENQAQLDKKLSQTGQAKDWTGKAGEMVGEGVVYAPIPGGASGGVLRRLGTSAAAGAVAGALQPTKTGESWVDNALFGAGAGAVGSAGMTALGKIVNSIFKPTKNAIQEQFDKAGVRASLGDVTQNPRIMKAETWLEEVPFSGKWQYVKEQKDEIRAMAKNYLAKYIIDPAAPDIRKMNRDYASAMFENLERVVSQTPNRGISPVETAMTAQELLTRYPQIFKMFQDETMEKGIKDIISGINKRGGTVDFKEMWSLREGIGELIGQARKKISTGDVNENQIGQLKALYNSVNKDIEGWTNTIGRPDIRELIKTANNSYKDLVVKYNLIEEALAKASPETSGKKVFSPQTFSTELKKLARGQEKGRYNLFSETEVREMAGIANIMQYAQRAGQFMENTPTGLRWGFPATVAGATAAATNFSGPTGLAIAGGAVSGVQLMRWLTTTESGKRFALSASKMNSDSLVWKSFIAMAYQQAAKMPALAATIPGGEQTDKTER